MDHAAYPIRNGAHELAGKLEAGLAWAKKNRIALKRNQWVDRTANGRCAVCVLNAAYCAEFDKTWAEIEGEVGNCSGSDLNPVEKWATSYGTVNQFHPAFIPKGIRSGDLIVDAVANLFDRGFTSTRIIKWLRGMVPA